MKIKFERCEGGFRIAKVQATESVVVLPSRHFGLRVIEIGSEALSGCKCEMVKLPKWLLAIGDSAFEGCEQLEGVLTNSTLVAIGNRAFYGCKSLQQVNWGWSCLQSVGSSAFECCEQLTDIVLPECVSSIGVRAFKDCKALKYFRNPSYNKWIESGTFRDSGLERIDVNDGVDIADTAFSGTKLESTGGVYNDKCDNVG